MRGGSTGGNFIYVGARIWGGSTGGNLPTWKREYEGRRVLISEYRSFYSTRTALTYRWQALEEQLFPHFLAAWMGCWKCDEESWFRDMSRQLFAFHYLTHEQELFHFSGEWFKELLSRYQPTIDLWPIQHRRYRSYIRFLVGWDTTNGITNSNRYQPSLRLTTYTAQTVPDVYFTIFIGWDTIDRTPNNQQDSRAKKRC